MLSIYEYLIELRLAQSQDKYSYAKAVKIVTRLRDTCRRADDADSFDVYLAETS